MHKSPGLNPPRPSVISDLLLETKILQVHLPSIWSVVYTKNFHWTYNLRQVAQLQQITPLRSAESLGLISNYKESTPEHTQSLEFLSFGIKFHTISTSGENKENPTRCLQIAGLDISVSEGDNSICQQSNSYHASIAHSHLHSRT